MSMFTLRRSQKQSGFTLMELLIVIAVLGLLLGLIAPRLGGITGDTADNVCDTNNKGIRYYTQMFYNQNNAYPSGLTNLVDLSRSSGTDKVVDDESTPGSTAQQSYLPLIQDDIDTEAEVISYSFAERNYPGAYYLNQAEITELQGLGISQIYVLQGEDRAMQRTTLTALQAASTPFVMMVGLTASDTSAPTLVAGPDGTLTFETGDVGNPAWLGRIFLAVNDQCELITTGMIQASALCPTAVLAETKFSHKEFTLVLPRLAATVDRVDDGSSADFATLFGEDYGTEEIAFVDASDSASGAVRYFTFEAQEGWEFDVSCPEGHKWPADDEENWTYIKASDI